MDQGGFILKDIRNVGSGGKISYLLTILMMKIIAPFGYGNYH